MCLHVYLHIRISIVLCVYMYLHTYPCLSLFVQKHTLKNEKNFTLHQKRFSLGRFIISLLEKKKKHCKDKVQNKNIFCLFKPPLPALWVPALSVLNHWLVLSSVQAESERTATYGNHQGLLKIYPRDLFTKPLSPFNTQKLQSSISAFKLLWNRII